MTSSIESAEQLLLVIDTETTGLDAARDRVIEVGAALLDVRSRTVVRTYGTLLYAADNPARGVNGIPQAALDLQVSRAMSLDPLLEMFQAAKWVAAHNAGFDKGMLEALLRANSVDCPQLPWICTVSDIQFPRSSGSRRLSHLAVDHGLSVVGAHRAISDVLILCALLQQLDDLEAQITNALLPRRLYAARVSYEHRQLAKDSGFRFCGESRQWRRRLTEAEVASLPFEVSVVDS